MTTFRKSGSGDTPTRTPDNLRSKDTVEVVLGLGMGPIKGPAYGLKGIYAGDTPLQNQNDSYNFKNFEYWHRTGAASDEAVKFRLGGQTNSTTVNVNLASGTPVVRQTPHGNIDAIKFRIVINSLLWQQDDGDVYQNTAKFKLEYKAASSATWLPCFPPTAELSIKGKTTSTYVKEYRVLVPRLDEPYDLRVTKTSPESDEEKICEITWESFQTIINGDKKFEGEAIAHYVAEASDQFSSLPQFWGVYDLTLCRMPNNYDPYTKTWDGSWDGITWKNDWTDNPALVFNEILMNETWGAAAYYPDVSLNKWDLVAAIEWCDEMVPDGEEGEQARYTFNGLLTEARSGPEMLRFVAGIFGGIPYDGLDGEIRLKLDVDSDAVALFTPENVIEENSVTFDYSYTDLSTRYNAISGTFTNPALDWSEDRVYLENTDAIEANGRIPLDLIAEACTNRHECTRRTMLRLITSQTEKTIVTFKTNRLGLTTELFDIFLVADPDMDWGITGRVKTLSLDRKTMNLRDQIYLEAGVDYEIVFQVPGGPTTAVSIPGTHIGALTQIVFPDALPDGVENLTTFVIQAPEEPSTPKPFRLVDIAEVEDRTDVVQITGLEVNRNKWAAADAAEYQGAPAYSRPLNASTLQPPTSLTVTQEAQYSPTGLFVRARLNWQPSESVGIKHYQVWLSRADDAPILQGTTEDSTFVIPDLPPGPYTFQVYPVSILNNLRSAVPAEENLYLGDTSGVGTSILTNLEILNQGVDTVFSGRDVVMSWVIDPPAGYFPLGNPTFDGSGFVDPTIAEFKVEILDADTDAVLFTDWTVNTYYRWTYLNNLTILSGPRREFKVQITGLTTYGIYTDPIVLEISNPPPSAPTGVSAAFDADAVRVSWDLPDDPDYAGTVVYMSTTNGFTPGPGNVVYRGIGPDARIAVTTTGDKYYRVGHYDAFSDTPTNLTAQQTFNVARLYVDDLDDAISDNVLSVSEKVLIVPNIERLRGGQTALDSRATALGITTQKTTYDSALSTLNATLATYTSPAAWNNYTDSTTIVGATLAAQLKAALDAELALQTKIDELNANALVPVGINRIYNSRMSPDMSGFGSAWNGNVGGSPTRGLNAVGKSGARNVAWVACSNTPANDTIVEGEASTGPTGSLSDMRRYACKVEAGDRLYASMLFGFTNFKNAYVVLTFGDATGAYLTETVVGSAVTAPGNGDNGTAMQRTGGFYTVPAGAHYAWLRPRFTANGTGALPVGYWAEPFLAVVSATQTVPPPFSHGEVARGAIVDAVSPSAQIDNGRVIGTDANRVPFSQFEKTEYWDKIEATSGGITITGLTPITTSGRKGLRVSITATGVGSIRFGHLDPYLARMQVGEKIAGQVVTANATGVCSIVAAGIRVYDSALANTSAAMSAISGGFTGQRWGLHWTPGGSYIWASIFVRVDSTGAGSGTFDIYEPAITGTASDQAATVFPNFNPGPNSVPGADITRQNPSNGLVPGASQIQSDGTPRKIVWGVEEYWVQDADNITFATVYDAPPRMKVLQGGKQVDASLSSTQVRDDSAVITTTGALVSLKLKNTVGTVTTQTQSTFSTVSTIRMECHKPTSADAWNGKYKFNSISFDVVCEKMYAEGEPTPTYWAYGGQLTATLYTNDSSGWVARATVDVGGYTTHALAGAPATITVPVTVSAEFNAPALGQHAGTEFAIEITAQSYPSAGNKINSISSLTYGTAGAPTSVSRTTPNEKVLVRFERGVEV